MFKNYLKIAVRNLWKQKGYTFINLAGMAVGMACCFLLLIYVHHEMHYDEFHPHLDRMYRVSYHSTFSENELEMVRIPSPMASRMKQDFPQVEQVARMYPRSISLRRANSERNFEIERAYFADSTIHEVFGFEFLKGNPETALDQPFSVVLTDETADRIFGNEDPMNQQLLLANEGPFTVTGVIRAFPENTHVHFDLLAPYKNMVDVEPLHARQTIRQIIDNNWLASHSLTYVLLKAGADPKDVDEAFPAFMERYGHKEMISNQRFTLFPVKDIHLRSTAAGEIEPQANPVYLRFFAAIGFLILLIACINFINLSTATYLTRTKEVGVRKVMGAGKANLIIQFMGETMLVSFLAFLIAMVCIDLFLPHLGSLVDKQLSFSYVENWELSAVFIGVFVLAGILAGSYPAFFASRFRPVEIFQDKIGQGSGGSSSGWLRKSLITVQFAVGILLISGTLIVLNQINFWRSQPLGFDHDRVISVPLQSQSLNSLFAPGDSTLRERMNTFEDRLLTHPNVEAITLGSALPGLGRVFYPVVTDEISLEDNVFVPCVSVDYDYAETFKLELVAGRDFDKSFGTDQLNGFVINEMAVDRLQYGSPEEAIGKKLAKAGKQGQVIGVVKNYHTAGLQLAMEPVILEIAPGSFSTFAIRLKNKDLSETIRFLEENWVAFFPSKAFEYTFVDEELASAYEEEGRLASLGSHFAGIAIFLSCFGLFGLISLTVQQRAKEIGIRKVLGATVPGIVVLLSKDFLKLVLVALVIATPVTWYLMNGWLEEFAYRIELQWWHFGLAGLLAVLVAFFTMSFQSIRAALANPVRSLRSE